MSFTSSSSYNIRPRFFPVVSSKKPEQGVVGNCVPHRAPTSPLRAYITRMELNREHGGSPGRAPCSQLAGSGHAGRGNTSAQPRTTHSLFLINRRATISQCLVTFSDLLKIARFLAPFLLHLHSDAVPAAAQQQVCIDDAPIYTDQTCQLKWKHTQLGNLMSTGG